MHTKKTIALVIPTLNEAENIESLYNAISKVALGLNRHTCKLIFIDDSTNEQTKQVIHTLATEDLEIVYLEGPRQGFAQAIAYGLSVAKTHAEIIVTLDADGSHNPEYIPAMVSVLEAGADLVIGSRYCSGASSRRKANQFLYSRSINALLRHATRSSITDYSSGYKAMRREVLATLELDWNQTVGYVCQVEFALAVLKTGFCIQEIPIDFVDRTRGHSKFKFTHTLEATTKILTYSLRETIRRFW